MERQILFVNFGGPRCLDEVESFLISLLTDKDVIRTKLPYCIHKRLFTCVAKKRARSIRHDYLKIGGKSPIFEDTESIASQVAKQIKEPVLTFHRYIPSTHALFFEKMKRTQASETIVFPLFPQFSFATTGSIARFFQTHLCKKIVSQMCWIKSYAAHPAYLDAMERCLRDFLHAHALKEEEVALLFSAHGLPQKFIETGDIYQRECILSFQALSTRFPQAVSQLSYQSKFGRGEWLRPYTDQICQQTRCWSGGRKNVIIVPLSFTSDHIETLFEIEEIYLPLLRASGHFALRCPALNLRKDWIDAIPTLLQETNFSTTQMLINKK